MNGGDIIKKIDMHTHTNYSDGIYGPENLVSKAIEVGLDGLAITDHDNICGIDKAKRYVEKKNLNFMIINGIEISSLYNEENVHILGYNIDITNKELLSYVDKIKDKRRKRAEEMITALNKLGLDISVSEVLKVTKNQLITRPNIGRVLIDKGYVKDMSEAFKKYLSESSPAYVSYCKLDPKEAIELINNAGGIPVLAHPGLNSEKTFKEVIQFDFKGIECFHPKHSDKLTSFFLKEAKDRSLIVTAGSDFHGSKPEDNLNFGKYYIEKR